MEIMARRVARQIAPVRFTFVKSLERVRPTSTVKGLTAGQTLSMLLPYKLAYPGQAKTVESVW